MRREKDFERYLVKNNISKKNIGYCRDHIEKAFGGKDMDEIILSHQNISNVYKKLKAIEKNENSINAYMASLNHYLKFAFEQGGLIKSVSNPKKIDSFAGPIVQYYFDVPTAERDETLRKTLEVEYPKILQFVEDVFSGRKGYIPVYLSKEAPSAKVYKLSKKFMDELRNKLQEQRNISDSERSLIYEILERKGYITNIIAQFFPGEKPYIEIYYKNLPTYNSLESAINILAHEYMHFLEYEYCFNNGCEAFADDRVSEALADFFGVLYSIKRGGKFDLEVAWNRYVAWKVLDGSGWPYAYALYFYQVKGKKMNFSSTILDYEKFGCVDKFREVFKATPKPVDAYNNLTKN